MTDDRTLKRININEQREEINALNITCKELAKDLQETIDTSAKLLKEYRDVADSAHKNAQWTMDAHHKVVEDKKALLKQIEEANKILEEFRLELFNTGEDKVDGSDYYTFDIDQTIKALKDALKIPRSDEQKPKLMNPTEQFADACRGIESEIKKEKEEAKTT